MIMSEKVKTHVDSCRFCWMCHHICPIGNATGHERSTPRARALGISLVNREAMPLEDIMDNIYECAGCGACVHDCVTGWDPVMFTKEVRLGAALDGKLPEYISRLVENCMETGNAYGKTAMCDKLTSSVNAHADKTDTLLVLGADTRYMVCTQGVKAINVLEKAEVSFTALKDEPATGAQMDYLVGAAEQTKEQMKAFAKVANEYKTVVVYDPEDAKVIKQTYAEYGIDVTAKVVTYTSYAAELVKSGKLSAKQSGKKIVFQDHFALSRDLGETEEAREIVKAYATLDEMLLNRKETVWAGNILMGQWMPEVMELVARRRIFNAKSVGASAIVTESPSEYANLKAAKTDIEILSLEDLILA